jgi:hypothetical protein
MSPAVEPLDLGPFARELDALRRAAAAAGPGADRVVLERARLLLQQLRAAPSLPAEGPEGGVAMGAGWLAERLLTGDGEVTLTCVDAAGETVVAASWRGAELLSLLVRAGERFWSARATAHGESRLGSDGTAEGPAETSRFADLAARAREELERWLAATTPPRWTCARCAWRNEEQDASCRLCGLPRAGQAATAGVAGGPPAAEPSAPWPSASWSRPGVSGLPVSAVLELPADVAAVLDAVIEGGSTVVVPLPAPAESWEVVVTACAAASRGAVAAVLRQAWGREGANAGEGAGASSNQAAERLLARPPAVVAGLDAETAESLLGRLQAAGATAEARRRV